MNNPYPGLRPFKSSESHLFSGREVVSSYLDTQVRISPLTLLFARSGVGKSSFLICRFLPNARLKGKIQYMNEWGGTSPDKQIDSTFQLLRATEDDSDEEKPLLIVDQFEDVFKLDYDRRKVWECLCDWVNIEEPPVHLVISMREEWLGAWAETSDYLPGTFNSMLRLAPLTEAELRQAILKPAAIEGTVQFEATLAENIVVALRKPNAFGMGTQYVEPGLLQVVCQRLWNEAVARGSQRVDQSLYTQLGGADQICREFVWRELCDAGKPNASFSALDRVLWVGLTRHLSVTQGVKSIVTASALARKLRIQDLGISGPAALDHELTPKERKYLDMLIEKRGQPPAALIHWISRVLSLGANVGFLKRQTGKVENEPLYELSHDAISTFLQQFALQYEAWIRTRWLIFWHGSLNVILLSPFLVGSLVKFGFTNTFLYILMGVTVLAVYVLIVFIAIKIFNWVYQALAFPLMRWLIVGDPSKSKRASRGV